MHMLQPGTSVQLSRKSPDALLKHALRVIRKGYGYPSLFNADSVVEEQIRQGKSLEDARAGGCSGCVETGAFGKEAFILTGYFNLVKVLELILHDGVDPCSGKQLGLKVGAPDSFATYEQLFDAYLRQLRYFIDVKIRGNQLIERLYATQMPAPFLSVLIDDCIANGRDYNAGGARYNNTFIQAVGIGSLADCLSGIKQTVFDRREKTLGELVDALDRNFEGQEPLRQRLLHRTSKYGNDDDLVDDLMTQAFNALFEMIDSRPNTKGGCYRLEMLPTTSHVYFGSVTGATPDGRKAGLPLSDGISPVQGADRNGPTAVIRSAAKMDHIKTGGTLLNMKFTPSLLEGEKGIDDLSHLVRSYFKLDGHHMQFNVVSTETLRKAQVNPDAYRDLLVRVAGYSDYFADLTPALQEEIIARTENLKL
jgi:formate C-acetyltransferase